jgi:hypothetical protein
MTSDAWFDGLDRRLDRFSLIVTLAALPVVFALHSPRAAFSVALGAVLSYVNFHWLRQAVDFVVLQGGEGRGSRGVLARFLGRYALIALVLYVTIRSSLVELVFVFAGLLVYVVAILIECISEVCRVLIGDYRNGRT